MEMISIEELITQAILTYDHSGEKGLVKYLMGWNAPLDEATGAAVQISEETGVDIDTVANALHMITESQGDFLRMFREQEEIGNFNAFSLNEKLSLLRKQPVFQESPSWVQEWLMMELGYMHFN